MRIYTFAQVKKRSLKLEKIFSYLINQAQKPMQNLMNFFR